jgi:hypothetical protein
MAQPAQRQTHCAPCAARLPRVCTLQPAAAALDWPEAMPKGVPRALRGDDADRLEAALGWDLPHRLHTCLLAQVQPPQGHVQYDFALPTSCLRAILFAAPETRSACQSQTAYLGTMALSILKTEVELRLEPKWLKRRNTDKIPFPF